MPVVRRGDGNHAAGLKQIPDARSSKLIKHKIKVMIVLDPNRKIKKIGVFVGVFVVILTVLALIFAGIGKKKRDAQLLNGQKKDMKSAEEKQQEMLEAIRKANAGQDSLTREELEKKQKEMIESISRANEGKEPLSQEEEAQKIQEMLKAISEANKK